MTERDAVRIIEPFVQSPKNRISRIDHLRAAAILLVFSDHFYVAMYGFQTVRWECGWLHWGDSPSPLVQLCRCTIFDGGLGVSLFFVVSGLCIRLAHLAARNYSITHFYWRRFWRIYPPYLIALLACVGVQHYRNIHDILSHLFLVHNFSLDYFYSINRPFWSLALEVQVYLLYPVLLLLHQRWGEVKTGLFLFVLSVASFLIGSESMCQLLHWPSLALARHLPTRLWFTWYAGFLLAEWITANRHPSRMFRVILLVALLLFPLVRMYRPLMVMQTPVAGIILTLLAWEYLNARFSLGQVDVALAWLGACSYSFYLYFDQLLEPILSAVSRHAHITSDVVRLGIGYPVTLLAIFAFSGLGYWIVELPSIALGQRLHRR